MLRDACVILDCVLFEVILDLIALTKVKYLD